MATTMQAYRGGLNEEIYVKMGKEPGSERAPNTL